MLAVVRISCVGVVFNSYLISVSFLYPLKMAQFFPLLLAVKEITRKVCAILLKCRYYEQTGKF